MYGKYKRREHKSEPHYLVINNVLPAVVDGSLNTLVITGLTTMPSIIGSSADGKLISLTTSSTTGVTGTVSTSGILTIDTPQELKTTSTPTFSGIAIAAPSYSTEYTDIFGDSLTNYSVNTGYNWPDFYQSFYPQAGTVTNKAVGGSTISTMLAALYAGEILGDSIIWIGYNNWMSTTYTIGFLKTLIQGVGAMAAYAIFKPPLITISSSSLRLTGTWINCSTTILSNRGLETSDSTATLEFDVNTRYVWVQLVLNGSSSTNNSISWTIDGTSAESTAVQVPNGLSGNPVPYDIFIDRGASMIGVSTVFNMTSLQSATTAKTFVIGFVTVNEIPSYRSTIVGPWQTWYARSHTLGGPEVAAAVDTGMRQVVHNYRIKGLDMRYVSPPMPMVGDLLGEAGISIHPNRYFGSVLASTFASVALAPNTTMSTSGDFTIPLVPTAAMGSL